MTYLLSTLMLGSCTPSIFKGMDKSAKTNITQEQLYSSYLEKENTYFFDTEIRFHDNVLNGIIVVQDTRTSNGELRAICTSVFGATVFDMVLTRDKMTPLVCPPQIQKKKIVNLIEQDLRMLFSFEKLTDTIEARQYKSEGKTGYEFKSEGKKMRFVVDDKTKSVEEKEKKGVLTKTTVNVEYDEDKNLRQLVLRHPKIKGSLTLKPIKQSATE